MCFGGRDKEDAGGAARSRELDKIIRADEKRMAKEVKLLLLGRHSARHTRYTAHTELTGGFLGAGESGKSTVLKQMKLIYAQGFSKNEKLEWKPVIFGNIVQSFRTIFDAMNEMDIKFELEENEASLVPDRGAISPGVPAAGRRSGADS